MTATCEDCWMDENGRVANQPWPLYAAGCTKCGERMLSTLMAAAPRAIAELSPTLAQPGLLSSAEPDSDALAHPTPPSAELSPLG